jgi:hypothetical protein
MLFDTAALQLAISHNVGPALRSHFTSASAALKSSINRLGNVAGAIVRTLISCQAI